MGRCVSRCLLTAQEDPGPPKFSVKKSWKMAKTAVVHEINDETALFAKVVETQGVMGMANQTYLLDPWPSDAVRSLSPRHRLQPLKTMHD